MKAIVLTTATNLVMTGFAAVAGLVIARTLGPSGRGVYAAVTAWFGVSLVVGEIGQTAATTYFVARQPERAADVVATSRSLMVVSGVIVASTGFAVANLLAHGDSIARTCYQVMFIACLPSFVGASLGFSLQARHNGLWNIMRISQPIAYLLCVLGAFALGKLTLISACSLLAITVVGQAALAYGMCRRVNLAGGKFDKALVSPLMRYGSSQMAAATPTTLNARLDQIVLSQTSNPAVLGQYAVGVSLTALITPVVGALGYVAFPKLAASKHGGGEAHRLTAAALKASTAIAAACAVVIVVTAKWVIPFLFGDAYSPAVGLVYVLAPAGALIAASQVMGDLLRGRGRPGAVAVAQGLAAVVSLVLLLTLIPRFGAYGAAWTSVITSALAFGLMLRRLLFIRDSEGGS